MDAEPAKPHFRVVAALIEENGRYLITQRPAKARMPLLWEFPGGKVEPGETDAEAIIREIRELMGSEVEPGSLMLHVTHAYKGYDLELMVYRCHFLGPEPRLIDINDFKWVAAEQLYDFQFPGADQRTVDALLEDLE